MQYTDQQFIEQGQKIMRLELSEWNARQAYENAPYHDGRKAAWNDAKQKLRAEKRLLEQMRHDAQLGLW